MKGMMYKITAYLSSKEEAKDEAEAHCLDCISVAQQGDKDLHKAL